MLENIKIAFIDLDGTLLNSSRLISKENIEAIKKLKNNNIKIVFSSGRWDTFMLEYNKDFILSDYIISNNGACIINVKNKEIIFEEKLSDNQISLLTNFCISNNLKIIYNGLFKQFDINEKINRPVYQSIISCDTIEKVDKLIKYINEIESLKINYISSDYYKGIVNCNYSINVNLNTTTKGKSISYLLSTLNIDKKDSICFGDNYNDLSMFEACGIKIAMENGELELKDKADYITLSNNENGIAYFINKYF